MGSPHRRPGTAARPDARAPGSRHRPHRRRLAARRTARHPPPDTTTQKRLETILTGAAEQAAALGGVFRRVTFKRTVAGQVFVTAIPADEVRPEFAWGGPASMRSRSGVLLAAMGRPCGDTSNATGSTLPGSAPSSTTSTRARPTSWYTPSHSRTAPRRHPSQAPSTRKGSPLAATPQPECRGLRSSADPVTARAFRGIRTTAGLGMRELDDIEPLLDNLGEAHTSCWTGTYSMTWAPARGRHSTWTPKCLPLSMAAS